MSLNTDTLQNLHESRMLTTEDNPFDPFSEFDEWFSFDVDKGYNTCAYLARVVEVNALDVELDETFAINQAINLILSLNLYGNYKVVSKKEISVNDSV